MPAQSRAARRGPHGWPQRLHRRRADAGGTHVAEPRCSMLVCHDVYGHDEGVGLFAGWRGRFRQNASVGVAGMWRP